MSRQFYQTVIIILIFFAGIYFGQNLASENSEEALNEAYEDGIIEGFDRCRRMYARMNNN